MITLRRLCTALIQSQSVLLFTSVISSLSWSTVFERHWTGPAFWYASILLSLVGLVLGAQQVLVLESITSHTWQEMRRTLAWLDSEGTWHCRRLMLYTLQSPIQCFAYSVICFLAGFLSYVFSPLAEGQGWNDNAKVRRKYQEVKYMLIFSKTAVVFGITISFVTLSSILCSVKIYQIA